MDNLYERLMVYMHEDGSISVETFPTYIKVSCRILDDPSEPLEVRGDLLRISARNGMAQYKRCDEFPGEMAVGFRCLSATSVARTAA